MKTLYEIEKARNEWVANLLGISPVYRDDVEFVNYETGEVVGHFSFCVITDSNGKAASEVFVSRNSTNLVMVPAELRLGLFQ
jgi:hypothetical protein